jgi:hypothetical protein
MKSWNVISAATLATLPGGYAFANPGAHIHPHLVEAAPLLAPPPALGLAGVVMLWAACVWVIEVVAGRRRPDL